MNYKIARSNHADINIAIQEATSELKKPQLILFFSGVDEFPEYAREIKNKFPEAITMGATTFAAFCKEGAYKDTLMVLGFEDGIHCEASLLEEVDKYALKYVESVKSKCEFCAK